MTHLLLIQYESYEILEKWKKKLEMKKRIEKIENSKRRSKDKQNKSKAISKLKVSAYDSYGIPYDSYKWLFLSFKSGPCSTTFAS